MRASSDEMVAALNERLWTYDDASFLPHGAAGDGDPMTQPIFLTERAREPNAATMLVRLSGAEASEADDAFDLVVLMFDGRDEAALAQARSEWRRLKDEGAHDQLLARERRGRLGAGAVTSCLSAAHKVTRSQ